MVPRSTNAFYLGIAFHPEGEHPNAVCPICSIEKEDHRLKRLHGIHGTLRGGYDAGIPNCWFQTPPVKLDGEGDAMDALRVCRYRPERMSHH